MSIRSAQLGMAVLAFTLAASSAWADWPPFGRAVVTDGNAQVHSVITTDGFDGAIIVWQDQPIDAVNVFAQHVRADGTLDPAWPAGGRGLLGDATAIEKQAGGQILPAVVSDQPRCVETEIPISIN